MNATPVWTQSFRVHTYEADLTARLKLSSLFNDFQLAAGSHADALGVGHEALREKGVAWFLSRILIRIDRHPDNGEELLLETWPKPAGKAVAPRDFTLSDRAGRICARGASQWVPVDLATFRARRPSEIGADLPLNEGRHAIGEAPGKLRFDGPMREVARKTAGYSELDVNGHVNNARYADWAMDCFDASIFAALEVAEIQIDYLAQVLPGSAVILNRDREASNGAACGIEGVSQADGRKHFAARILWRARA